MFINVVLGRRRFQYRLKTQVLHNGKIVILAIDKFGFETLRISLIERGKEDENGEILDDEMECEEAALKQTVDKGWHDVDEDFDSEFTAS